MIHDAELRMEGVQKFQSHAATGADADNPLRDIGIINVQDRTIRTAIITVALQFTVNGCGQGATAGTAARDTHPLQLGRNS
jgi:hypothetical protein